MSDLNEDDSYSDLSSETSQFSNSCDYETDQDEDESFKFTKLKNSLHSNITVNLISRQVYGRVTKCPKSPTDSFFHTIPSKCRLNLSTMIDDQEGKNHVYMGFSLCGQFIISFVETILEFAFMIPFACEYEVFLWRFSPGSKLLFVSKHRIFKRDKLVLLDKITFMQFPNDPYKLICYGTRFETASAAFITVLTLPFPKSCRHCKNSKSDSSIGQGWCTKHGFILHYMFTLGVPCPKFNPQMCLAYPDYLIINTGHYIHILNVTTKDPAPIVIPTMNILSSANPAATTAMANLTNLVNIDEGKFSQPATPYPCCNDACSEISESPSDNFSTNSIGEGILEDFNEYEPMENAECYKPFHELSISCDPMHIAVKNYHHTLNQTIADARSSKQRNQPTANTKDGVFSVPQTSANQKLTSSAGAERKVDKKTAEKAYEFTEDNEKCEKLSSFRKKRLAEKKYEFCEDNNENIVPFNSLRRERRFLCTSQNHYASMRSPDIKNFCSRSPQYMMPSPTYRGNGQFSPSGGACGPSPGTIGSVMVSAATSARHMYCTSIRNSPHHYNTSYCRSPVSPREITSSSRKLRVNSPSLDSDCSDNDSKCILRLNPNFNSACNNQLNSPINQLQQQSLLVVTREPPKWIKKVVRRYSNGDYENGSLLSGHSRDDFNVPIEVPLLVQTLTEQHLDALPDFKMDQMSDMQLIATQRTFDFDQFVQTRAHEYCEEAQLQFLHCKDYDLQVVYVCPLTGNMLCQSVIKMAVKSLNVHVMKSEDCTMHCLFLWNVVSDDFQVVETIDGTSRTSGQRLPDFKQYSSIAKSNSIYKRVHVMDCSLNRSKVGLRDYNNNYEIYIGGDDSP